MSSVPMQMDRSLAEQYSERREELAALAEALRARRNHRAELLTEFMDNESFKPSDRLRAIELAAKADGDYAESRHRDQSAAPRTYREMFMRPRGANVLAETVAMQSLEMADAEYEVDGEDDEGFG